MVICHFIISIHTVKNKYELILLKVLPGWVLVLRSNGKIILGPKKKVIQILLHVEEMHMAKLICGFCFFSETHPTNYAKLNS
jgi:hypothetical protein